MSLSNRLRYLDDVASYDHLSCAWCELRISGTLVRFLSYLMIYLLYFDSSQIFQNNRDTVIPIFMAATIYQFLNPHWYLGQLFFTYWLASHKQLPHQLPISIHRIQ